MIRAAVLLLALTLPAATDGPGPDFQPEDQPADVSPDGQVEVRQYFKPGNDYVFQFWTFDRDHQHAHLLNPGETGTMTQYAAGFRFSPDSQWLVRMQKVAAGESTLFLYRRDGVTYAPATPKPLGDLAWDYLFSQPEGQAVAHAELSRETVLVRGMDDDYRSLGQHWPPSRFIVISLFSGESATTPVGPWRCVYDPQTSTFSVPPDFAAFNHSKMPWK